jgi:hypothetical protein
MLICPIKISLFALCFKIKIIYSPAITNVSFSPKPKIIHFPFEQINTQNGITGLPNKNEGMGTIPLEFKLNIPDNFTGYFISLEFSFARTKLLIKDKMKKMVPLIKKGSR